MSIHFSKEQKDALELFKSGQNICLTGPGGTGKSLLIREMYKWGKENKKNISVTALTGCAAYLLVDTQGRTIHSWSGVYRYNDKDVTPKIIDAYVRMLHKKRKGCMANWLTTDILIIDEISMMSSNMFTLLDGIGRKLRSHGFNDESILKRSFGGIQLVLVGDFLQIPPVVKEDTTKHMPPQPIFECPSWRSIIRRRSQVIALKKNFRALHDPKWADMLLQLRQGKCTIAIKSALESRLTTIPYVKQELKKSDVKPTVLVSTHLQVDAMNIANLEKCPKDTHTEYTAQPMRFDMETKEEKEIELTDMSRIEKEAWKEAFENSLIQTQLKLRQGAQVMCTTNIDITKGLVNGARGVVRRFDIATGFPVIYWKSLQRETIMKPTLIPTRHPLLMVKQIPLCQAWAITIHKSQGQTLDCVEVDIGSSVFVAGQAYVALSRVRSLDTLYISDFSLRSIWADPYAKRFCAAIGDT